MQIISEQLLMSASLPSNTIESYYVLMQNWNPTSKKDMIVRLLASLDSEPTQNNINCFGAWKDDRNADEIINEIYSDRRNHLPIEEL